VLTKIKTFLREVRLELKKVSWPSREVTIGSTWVVLTVCVVFALYFFVADFVINRLVMTFLSF
jgi:preprotein translocase subunit SecE